MGQKNWYAVYTKPRWEKKVFSLLSEKGFTTYCPLHKVRRRWSDRYKVVEEPVFKSYVFVNIRDEEISKVKQENGVVNFVYWNNRPAVIRNEEISLIKRFLNEYDYIEASPVDLKPEQRVKIMNGVLMDNEAVVVKTGKNKVQVILVSLGFKLTAHLIKNEIRPVS